MSTALHAATGYPDLLRRVRAGELGPDPAHQRISVAFSTSQAVRHPGRTRGYHNEVLSLRLAGAVGCCAVEPGALRAGTLDECVGVDVATLLDHRLPAVRVAALDAYLLHAFPPHRDPRARPHRLPAGTSLDKSRARARAVADLLPATARQVLVVGVVNSLLEALRARGIGYLPCDLKGGSTEWDEPIHADAAAVLDRCDALLVSGMTLGNGSFEALRQHAAHHGKPLVVFAQTGSAIAPRLLAAGVSAVCAEPYPFFWLDGGDSVIYRYGQPC
ncbi:DUF364 domain-containing protein [Streptomyces sp. HSW2009]|uniref:Rossmann-like domain-containing protein n=1 Tax=Streptomyces sp. HSW2009 TaxID=3142890 RepID=UPI0032EBF760